MLFEYKIRLLPPIKQFGSNTHVLLMEKIMRKFPITVLACLLFLGASQPVDAYPGEPIVEGVKQQLDNAINGEIASENQAIEWREKLNLIYNFNHQFDGAEIRVKGNRLIIQLDASKNNYFCPFPGLENIRSTKLSVNRKVLDQLTEEQIKRANYPSLAHGAISMSLELKDENSNSRGSFGGDCI
jgi:hypothetical protein